MGNDTDFYSDLSELKDYYPYFHFQLLDFISSLPERHFFKSCYDIDGNGSRFSIELRDIHGNAISVLSLREDNGYTFNQSS